MLKTICQIMFICCIPMLSGKENVGQEYVSYIENCIEVENFEQQEYSAIEGKYIADTETLLEVQKELEQLQDESFYIRLENGDLDTSELIGKLAGCWQQNRRKNQYALGVAYKGEIEKRKDAMMPFCSLMEEECSARVEKELAKKGGFPSYIRLERLNGLDIYTFCIYISGEKSEEEFLIILNGTWEGQEVCWQYVTFPAVESIYDNDLISYQYLKYPPYDEYAVMNADINFDGCADLFIRESLLGIMENMHYHGIIWDAVSGEFVLYESFPKQVSRVQFDKQRMIYHRDEWGVEYITEYRVIDGEYVATRELVWNEKDKIVFYYEMGVLVREHPNMGYTDKYGLYPDLDYWWKG